MKVTSYNTTGAQSTTNLSDELFGAVVNQVVLSQAIRVYRSNLRQGTSKVKTRSEVARTKKKWFKQKGTGNARHGARTPNIFVGGGVSHGPNGEQNWRLSLPQKMKHAALISAFSAQAAHVVVHEGVDTLAGQTKLAIALLTQIEAIDKKVLMIVSHINEKALRSLRNVANILVTDATRVTALEVVSADAIVFTPSAVTALTARLSGEGQAEVEAETETAVVVKPAAKPVVKKVAKAAAKPAAKSAAKPPAKKSTTTKSTKTKKA